MFALALDLLPRLGKLLDFGRGLFHFSLDLLQRQCSGSDRAVREDQCWRGVDVVLLAELGGLCDGRRTIAFVVRQLAAFEPLVP